MLSLTTLEGTVATRGNEQVADRHTTVSVMQCPPATVFAALAYAAEEIGWENVHSVSVSRICE